MEENFHILQLTLWLGRRGSHLSAGDFIHIEPGEVHYVINSLRRAYRYGLNPAPFQEVDKAEVENPYLLHQHLAEKPALDEKIVQVQRSSELTKRAACGGPLMELKRWNISNTIISLCNSDPNCISSKLRESLHCLKLL